MANEPGTGYTSQQIDNFSLDTTYSLPGTLPYVDLGSVAARVGGVSIAGQPAMNVNMVGGSISIAAASTVSVANAISIASDPYALSVATNATITGTIPVQQSTSPWVVSGDVSIPNNYQLSIAVNAGGSTPVSIANALSIASFTPGVIASVVSVPAVSVANALSIASLPAVTGTIASQQSTSPWVVSGTVSVPNALSIASVPAISVANSVIRSNVLVPALYDALSLAQDSTHDTWYFRTGGLGGASVATVVITYTDATKDTIGTVVKS
jgi:hypothetical protein